MLKHGRVVVVALIAIVSGGGDEAGYVEVPALD